MAIRYKDDDYLDYNSWLTPGGFSDNMGRTGAGVTTFGLSETGLGQKPGIKQVGDVGSFIASAGGIFGSKKKSESAAAKAQREYQERMAAERARRRDTQLGILGGMQAPQMSPLAAKRIAALDSESQDRALSEDPLYAGQRATLLGAGQQLQSGVENEQLGRGVRGGFANIGSTQDVQDRLGVQLANLSSNAIATREKKRDMAAQAQQDFQNAQTEFQNARARAQMAIESGDSDLAVSMINQAMQAKQTAAAAERQMQASMIGMAGTIGGAMIGGPMGAVAGKTAADQVSGGGYSLGANTDYGQPQQFEGFEVQDTGSSISSQPFAATRRGYRL